MKLKNLLLSSVLVGACVCSTAQHSASPDGTVKTRERLTTIYTLKMMNSFINLYKNRQTELPLCQYGYKDNSNYIIDDFKMPFIYLSTPDSSSFGECEGERYLGIIHNHKYNYDMSDSIQNIMCLPSDVDVIRFIRDKIAKLESIVCISPNQDTLHIKTLFKELIPDSIINKYK